FCSGGKQLLAGAKDGQILIFDIAPFKQFATLRGHKKEITRMAVDAKESTLVSADDGGNVVVWPLAAALFAKAPPVAPPVPPVVPPAALDGNAVEIPGLKRIIDKKVQGVYRVEILPDNKSFISGGLRLEHWDMDGNLRKRFASRTQCGDLFAMAVTPDGQRVLWGEALDSPQLLDIATGQVLGGIPRRERVSTLALAPAGKLALVAFGSESTVVWNMETQQVVQELPKQGHVTSLGFAPDGKLVFRSHLTGRGQ